MNPLCLQTDWVNFMQILCLFEILTQTYMKQPLERIILLFRKMVVGHYVSIQFFSYNVELYM